MAEPGAADLARLGLGPTVDAEDVDRLARAATGADDRRVRAVALAALARQADRAPVATLAEVWRAGVSDTDPGVRRRAAETAPAYLEAGVGVEADLVTMVRTDDPLVAEAAAFTLGELNRPGGSVVEALAEQAREHDDVLVREACVAALGSLGDPSGLPAVLAGLSDRPPVRRRAVLALAAFEGPHVESALRHALQDRDWQVRQAAEDLLG